LVGLAAFLVRVQVVWGQVGRQCNRQLVRVRRRYQGELRRYCHHRCQSRRHQRFVVLGRASHRRRGPLRRKG
jgi:hypothetical protein